MKSQRRYWDAWCGWKMKDARCPDIGKWRKFAEKSQSTTVEEEGRTGGDDDGENCEINVRDIVFAKPLCSTSWLLSLYGDDESICNFGVMGSGTQRFSQRRMTVCGETGKKATKYSAVWFRRNWILNWQQSVALTTQNDLSVCSYATHTESICCTHLFEEWKLLYC